MAKKVGPEWNAEAVKVGDRYAVQIDGRIVGIYTVERLTRTQVIAGGAKFRRHDGRKISTDRWHFTYLRPLTLDRIAEIERAKAIQRLSRMEWRNAPDALLFAVDALVEAELARRAATGSEA